MRKNKMFYNLLHLFPAFLLGSLLPIPVSADVASWFKNVECLEMTINKYKTLSSSAIPVEIVIKDIPYIKEIRQRITLLPVDGKELLKPAANTPRLKLSFRCADGSNEVVEFLGKKIRTPSKGFLGTKDILEANLFRDLDALVDPDLNKRIPKIKDQFIKFKGFSIVYAGEKKTPQDPNGPTIGPTSESYYNVRENDSANQVTMSIFEGQIPPQPQSFAIGKKVFYLLTYLNGAGESLHDKYYEISKSVPKR